MVRLLSAAVVVACALAPPARAEVLARIPNPSAVSVYRGTVVVSVRSAGGYRLAVVERGRARPLPVAPRAEPFDADVGPDTRGRPVVVYSRCRGTAYAFEPQGCDLRIYRFATRREEPVRTASTRAASEFQPTVWRARIAYASADGERTRVLTRSRLAPRADPAGRAPAVPRTPDLEAQDLELRGRHLAALLTVARDGPTSTAVVRVVDLRRRTGRTLERIGQGIGGQTAAGLSFAGDRLGWAPLCLGDPAGCDGRGPRTYDLRTRRLRRGTAYRPAPGWSLAPGATVAVRGHPYEAVCGRGRACTIVRRRR